MSDDPLDDLFQRVREDPSPDLSARIVAAALDPARRLRAQLARARLEAARRALWATCWVLAASLLLALGLALTQTSADPDPTLAYWSSNSEDPSASEFLLGTP